LGRNVQRDTTAIAQLASSGWGVLVIWECETSDTAAIRRRLRQFLGK
jgi:G:T-mismatch repair DNA endonuclease (very short patch repair protein)